jgi:hypothetical protein
MSARIEGTFRLDGLLEGPRPETPEQESRLHHFVNLAARRNIEFQLEVEGDTFSLLAGSTPAKLPSPGTDLTDEIRQLLVQLLSPLPAQALSRVNSSLRSIEYRKGVEVQTVYAIRPDGTVEFRQRTVETETESAPHPRSRKDQIKMVLTGIGVACLLLLVSSFFVDYGSLLNQTLRTLSPLDAAKIALDASAYQKYFSVETCALRRQGDALLITLKRTPAYPLKESDFDAAQTAAEPSLRERLSVEALAHGYVRCEYFDDQGAFLGFSSERIEGLRTNETVELVLPLPRQRRLGRIVITH